MWRAYRRNSASERSAAPAGRVGSGHGLTVQLDPEGGTAPRHAAGSKRRLRHQRPNDLFDLPLAEAVARAPSGAARRPARAAIPRAARSRPGSRRPRPRSPARRSRNARRDSTPRTPPRVRAPDPPSDERREARPRNRKAARIRASSTRPSRNSRFGSTGPRLASRIIAGGAVQRDDLEMRVGRGEQAVELPGTAPDVEQPALFDRDLGADPPVAAARVWAPPTGDRRRPRSTPKRSGSAPLRFMGGPS